MFRQTLLRNARLFSTSVRVNKGPVEAGKDAVKNVDRSVSDTIVKGIEKGGEFLPHGHNTDGHAFWGKDVMLTFARDV